MQRTEAEGIVISCDFCGTDWDEVVPMVEGHQGSILCLPCLRYALEQSDAAPAAFKCTMCLVEKDVGTRHWAHPAPQPSPGLNAEAAICWDCVRLAAKTFHKDKDTDFTWSPSDYPQA